MTRRLKRAASLEQLSRMSSSGRARNESCWTPPPLPTAGPYGSQLFCEIIHYNNVVNNPGTIGDERLDEPSIRVTPCPRHHPPSSISSIAGSLVAMDYVPAPPPPPMRRIPPSRSSSSSESSLAMITRPGNNRFQQQPGGTITRETMKPIKNSRASKRYPIELQKAIRDIQFIQNHMKRADEYDEVWWHNGVKLAWWWGLRSCSHCFVPGVLCGVYRTLFVHLIKMPAKLPPLLLCRSNKEARRDSVIKQLHKLSRT